MVDLKLSHKEFPISKKKKIPARTQKLMKSCFEARSTRNAGCVYKRESHEKGNAMITVGQPDNFQPLETWNNKQYKTWLAENLSRIKRRIDQPTDRALIALKDNEISLETQKELNAVCALKRNVSGKHTENSRDKATERGFKYIQYTQWGYSVENLSRPWISSWLTGSPLTTVLM